MLIAPVQRVLSQTTSAGANAPTINSTVAGNFLVVFITYFGGGTDYFSSIAGTNNSYVQIGSTGHVNTAPSDFIRMYYAKNIHGGNETVTVSFSGSPGSGDTMVDVCEYSGGDLVNLFDKQSMSTAGSGTNPLAVALTPTNPNALVVALELDDFGNNAAATVDSPFTLRDHQDDSNTHERIQTADVIQTTAVSAQASFHLGASSNFIVQQAAFNAAAGGAAAPIGKVQEQLQALKRSYYY